MRTVVRVSLACSFFAAVAATGCTCDDGGGLGQLLPDLRVDPSIVDFGEIAVGKERTGSIRFTNAGEATLALAVTMSSATGEFILLNTAPNSLAPSQSIELSVKYTALSLGDAAGSLGIVSNDADAPTSIELRGKGVVPTIDVRVSGDPCGDTPGSLSFGTAAQGQTVDRIITIESTGAAPVHVRSAAIAEGASGEWSLEAVPEEGVELLQNQKLELTASYTPVDSGQDNTAFIITTDVPNRMNIRVPVCGVGAQPALCGSPVPLDFGELALGVRKGAVLRLENCSQDPFELSSVAIVNDAAHPSHAGYQLDNVSVQLPATLEPGSGVDVTVSFAGDSVSMTTGWIRATTGAATQPEAFFPMIANARDTCLVLLAPSRIVYNHVVVGASDRKNVLVANDGVDACAIRSAQITQGSNVYSIVNGRTAPYELASGFSETLVVRYQPRAGGVTDRGILQVEAGATIHEVELLGNPPFVPGCQIEVIPGFINFGAIPRNSTVLRSVDVRNVSEAACNIISADLDPASSPQFTNVQFAAGAIGPGERTTVLVNFRAPQEGTVNGTVQITTDDIDTPIIDVPLFGSAAPPSICVEPLNLDFGSINNGTLDFRVHACGSSPVTITDLAFTRQDPEFGMNNAPQLPLTLQPGEMQPVTVLYESLDQVGDSAIVTVGSDDLVTPTVQVGVTAGPVIVPPTAGRYLYYWQINSFTSGESNIFRIPLQGQPTPEAYWGPLAGKPCTGCHGVSPDGRYVAVIEATNFSLTVIDTTTDIELSLPFTVSNTAFFTWNPDVNANPPYQFAYDENDVVKVASIVAGYIGELQGANDRTYGNKMPSWGPDGKIAFARGAPGGGWGFFGPSEIMLVDELGGVPVPLAGAGANGGANYYPAYHPNGEWVAFNHSASAQGTLSAWDGEIWMVSTNQNGTVLRLPNMNCAPGQCSSSFPTWSIDGSFLSFSSNRSGSMGSWDLYIGPVDPVTGADLPAQNIIEANTPEFQHAARWSY